MAKGEKNPIVIITTECVTYDTWCERSSSHEDGLYRVLVLTLLILLMV